MRLLCIQGRAWARLGSRANTEEALAACRTERERAAGSNELHDHIGGEFGFTEARQAFCSGSAYLQLGDTGQALEECERAVGLYEASPAGERWYGAECSARADLAATRLLQGELDEACEALAPVFALPPDKRVQGLVKRLGNVQRLLSQPPGLVGLVRRLPPGDTSMAMSDNSALVRRFVDAYNRGDTEAIVVLVTPDVELETPGGLERGPEAAQRLAAKSTQEHALVHIEIERLVEVGDQVVVFAERQMRWRETGELADASPSDAVMTIRGGKVARWQRLRDRREALRRAGLEPTEPATGEGEGDA